MNKTSTRSRRSNDTTRSSRSNGITTRSSRSNDTTIESSRSDDTTRSSRFNGTTMRSTRSSKSTYRKRASTSSVEDRQEDRTLASEGTAAKKAKKSTTKDEIIKTATKTTKPKRDRPKKAAAESEVQENDDRYARIVDEEDEQSQPVKKSKKNTKKGKKDSSESKENESREINSNVNSTKSSTSSTASPSASSSARLDRPDDQNEKIGESNESNDYDVQIIRKIFKAAQFSQKLQNCVQALYRVSKEFKFDEFYEEFSRDVKCILQFEAENEKVVSVLDMIATFMISVKSKNLLENEVNENMCDEIGLKVYGKKTFTVNKIYKNLLDHILNDPLIPFLGSANANTRLNTLYLVRKILKKVVDIEPNIYERLKSALIDRTSDKNANVRKLAFLTIHRFQGDVEDPDDMVTRALRFHLKYDPTDVVRLTCLNVICPIRAVIPDLILKTRDIKSKIRETAFKKIAKNIDPKQLTIDQRLTLLNNGLKDRDPKVNRAVHEFLVPAWIKCYDDNLIELLNDLEVILNEDAISKFLEIAFRYSFSIKIETRTKLHLLIDQFYTGYLDQQSLLTKRPLSPENCLFWRCLGAFMKKNEDELFKCQADLEKRMNLRKEIHSLLEAIDDLEVNSAEEVDNAGVPEVVNKTNSEYTVDANYEEQSVNRNDSEAELNHQNSVDLIMPSLSNFVAFFQNFCFGVNANEYEQDDLIKLEFIFKQLCLFFDNYDIADDSQKKLIINLAEQIILMDELGSKFDDYIEHLMRFLSKSVLRTNEELISYTVDITNKVEASLEEENQQEELLPEVDPEKIRKLERDLARESLACNEMRIRLDVALVNENDDIANKTRVQVGEIESRIETLNNQIRQMQNMSIVNQSMSDSEIEIQDHSAVHLKLLQIFGSCLRFGHFENLTAMMNTRINGYVIPGILSTDSKIRYYALKALNQACFLSSSLAATYCTLYHEICTKDSELLRNCALQGLIDSLMEHGLQILCPNEEEPAAAPAQRNEPQSFAEMQQQIRDREYRAKKSAVNSMFTNTREFTRASSFLNRSEISSPNISMQSDEANRSLQHNTNNESDLDREDSEDERLADLTMRSQIIDPKDLNKTAEQLQIEEEVLKRLTKFLLQFIRSDEEEIKSTAVMGICKLLLLGRIYSPLLLSELILLWYNSSTSKLIQHDIGAFMPIYCLASSTYQIDIPEHFSGQHCLLDCFMSTVENVYRLERGEQLDLSIDLMRSNYYDSDIDVLNVIDFMLNLLEPVNHVKTAFEFCRRLLEILQIDRDDEHELKEPFISKYLIRSLESFKLFEMDDVQLEELKQLVAAIQAETRYGELKKPFKIKIEKFSQKLSQL